MPAKAGLTVKNDITVAVRELDFVTRFDFLQGFYEV